MTCYEQIEILKKKSFTKRDKKKENKRGTFQERQEKIFLSAETFQ